MANDPSSVIDGKVNVLTGLPCIAEEDLVIQGAEPIRISRVYIHGPINGEWRIPGEAARISVTEKDYRWVIEEPDECPIIYRKEGQSFLINGESYIRCIPSNLNTGFSNTSRGKISSRTNLRNHYVLLDEKKIKEEGKPKNVTIHRANGSIRTYKRVRHCDKEFLLLSECLPNGNWILYDYESLALNEDKNLPKLRSIRTTNADKTKEYARAQFVYKDPKGKNKNFYIAGSDGQTVEYLFEDKQFNSLKRVVRSGLPDQSLHFTDFEIFKNVKEHRLDVISYPLQRRACIDYYKNNEESVVGKMIKMKDGREDIFQGNEKAGSRLVPDFRRGLVKTISSPIGTDAEIHPTHSIIYNNAELTSVFDPEKKRTDYYNDGYKRLKRIERFSKEGTLQNGECYAWRRLSHF